MIKNVTFGEACEAWERDSKVFLFSWNNGYLDCDPEYWFRNTENGNIPIENFEKEDSRWVILRHAEEDPRTTETNKEAFEKTIVKDDCEMCKHLKLHREIRALINEDKLKSEIDELFFNNIYKEEE